jgi:YggT family protein
MLTPIVATLLWIFDTVIGLYILVVFLAVIMSWLIAFGVLNTRNDLARSLVNFLDALTEPVFRRVRRIVPPIGGFDLSPIIVFIVLFALRNLVDAYVAMAMFGRFG